MNGDNPPPWPIRLGMLLLLVGAYVWPGRPLRAAFMRHVAYPVVASLGTERSAQFALDLDADPLTLAIRARSPDRSDPPDVRAPVGLWFIVPAVMLMIRFPSKPYWLYFGGYHLGLGLCSLAAITIGLGWTDGGFEVHKFLRIYIVPATSLLVLLVVPSLPQRRSSSPASSPA